MSLSYQLILTKLIRYRTVMRGSRNFRQGGGSPGQSDKKALTTIILVLSLFYSRKWLISKKTIIFQGSRGGPTFSRGVGSSFFRVGGSKCLFA